MFRLKFAIVNQSREDSQRWLNEIFSEDYQCSNISDLSNEDDEEGEDTNEEVEDHEYVSVHGSADPDRTIMAINGRNSYFQTFRFRYRGSSTRSELLFARNFSNWLDKLTEGLCKEKTHVAEWPSF
jgi:hypothetical protein